MLKDRVQISEKGFRVIKPEAERELYYKEFNLSTRPDDFEELIKMEYWNPAAPQDSDVENKRFVMIVEKNGEDVVESYSFYFCLQKSRPNMRITTKPIRNYGKGARVITIYWETREKINNYYIWLRKKNTGEKYLFLTEHFSPLSESKMEDSYIFYPEEGVPEDHYEVAVDSLLQQKYQVTIDS